MFGCLVIAGIAALVLGVVVVCSGRLEEGLGSTGATLAIVLAASLWENSRLRADFLREARERDLLQQRVWHLEREVATLRYPPQPRA